MPVSTPPTVAFGDPLLASGLDALILAADDRFGRLFSGARSWYAFDTTSLPTQQVPPVGAVYIISEDADRDILPAPGTPGGPNGTVWPAKYDHAAHVAVAAAMTITGPDALDIAWEVTGAFPPPDVYLFADSPSVLERTHLGESRPLKLSTAYEPERFHRYAIADVLIESAADDTFSWTHDKYGVVRIHNLSRFSVTVDLGSSSVSVGARRIRTVRRTSRTAAWDTTDRKYFPRALPGDIPIWDSYTASMANLPLRSQSANPIFRQSLLQYMFQPHALTDNPGMFSSTIVPVLPDVGVGATIASAIVQQGTFDAVRTSTLDPTEQETFTLLYSGETLASTPPDWAAVGLRTSLDDSLRGAVLDVDPGFAVPPGIGAWQFDAISRTTNLLGGIVVAVNNGSVFSRTVLPWFEDATAADAWYSALFLWPTYDVTRTATEVDWISDSIWTPLGGPADPDYFGSWSAGTINTAREYLIEWDGSSLGTVSTWNVFTKTVASALPATGTLVRQPLLTAVVAYPSVSFWADRDDATWDDEGPVTPRANANDRGIYVASDVWGLGTVDGDELTEPRWQLALFPTIGWNPASTWFAYPFYGAEEIIWTPFLPDGSGGTLSHWRVVSPEGAADGAGWEWNFAGTYSPVASEPDGAVGSGMSFWRMFAQSTHAPGAVTSYPGKSAMGPQPWTIRDHGWIADEILSTGAGWQAARPGLYDSAPIDPAEERTGFQLRVNAAAFNQISALIAGMSHVRPCGWEQYVDGFPFSSLVRGSVGWYLGYSDLYAQPFGAVHIYALDFAVDALLDAAGVSRRSASNADLQAFQSITLNQYVPVVSGLGETLYYDASVFGGSGPWDANLGNSRQYCTADDIHDALAVEGFAFNQIRLVQPIDVETYDPGTDETETDVITPAADPGTGLLISPPYRIRAEFTVPIPVPATTSALQIAPADSDFYEIAAERPMRASLVTRDIPGPDVSLRTTGPTSGPTADSMDRFLGEFRLGSGTIPLWSATVLARAGLTAKVLCLPCRRLLSELRAEDGSGTRTRLGLGFDFDYNSPLVLPDAVARPKWLSVEAGDSITVDMLAGASPAYPDKHHVWQLLPIDGSIEAM